MIGVSNITSEEELQAFVTAFAPYFFKYLSKQSKNIFDCEVATSIDHIKTMPALYDDGNGVRKQVVAPLQLLTKDVDKQIAAATAIEATEIPAIFQRRARLRGCLSEVGSSDGAISHSGSEVSVLSSPVPTLRYA